MKTTRRDFIKQSAGAISISFLLPTALQAARRTPFESSGRRILVLVQMRGGNDGLNTFIPYRDSNYHQLRPNLRFTESDLKDDAGNTTIVNNEFGFHPALKELKDLYVQGKLAVVLGVGYPNTDLSHEVSTSIWQTANLDKGKGLGLIGRYADLVFNEQANLPVIAIGSLSPPQIISSDRRNIPMISRLGDTAFETRFGLWRENVINAFRNINARSLPSGSFIEQVARVGASAEGNSGLIESVIGDYQSSVVYAEDNPAAQALKSVAILATSFPESNIFHVGYPSFFDTHAEQIGTKQDGFLNKRVGVHATDLTRISQAIKSFYDDMAEHGLAENVVIATYSEFGRRPNENASHGTDHGSSSVLFVAGDRVKGGDIYGLQPALSPTSLDRTGNMQVTTDFRSVYSTLIDNWLGGVDSQELLGGRFPHLGFL